MRMMTAAMLLMALAAPGAGAEPLHEAQLIFPLESWHNHGSCIIECPNGDLLTCWFHGSGERKSDDVLIEGARKAKGADAWSARFVMADSPGFPDTNCCMIIDPQQRLWLLWPTIQANTWESALMKYKISDHYTMAEGAPEWNVMKVLHAKPGADFVDKVRLKADEYVASIDMPDGMAPLVAQWKEGIVNQAADKLTRRLGWFTRAHPLFLEDGRLLVGLYSDGFSFSLVAISDDLGETWSFSDPLVGGGNIQPSFARKRDGTLVSFMRDNGPAPKRVLVSESADRGQTWSLVHDHPTLNNPGSGLELMTLSDGDWVVIYNDEPMGRHSLAVSLSDDEGATWKWTRHLELTEPRQGSFHYPSITEGSDGSLHASYSYFVPDDGRGKEGKSIKYAKFNKAWIKHGDPPK